MKFKQNQYTLYKAYAFWFLAGNILLSSCFATAQRSAEDHQSYTMWFGRFQHKAISTQKISVSMKNNKVDLSPVFKIIDQLRETDYAGDLLIGGAIIRHLSAEDGEFKELCEKLVSKSSCEKVKDSLESAFYKVAQEKENQILYPERYHNIYGRSKQSNDEMIQLANEILDSECLGPSDDWILSEIILRLHPSRWPEGQDKLKNQDKKSLNQILQRVSDELEKEKYPEQCLHSANKDNRVCKQIRKELAVKTQRFKYLTELVYGKDIIQTTEAKAPCLDCEEGSLTKGLLNLGRLFSFLKEHSLCADPAIGEEKQVINNRESYTVRREPDGSFLIPLNLSFVPAEDYDGEIPKADVPAHYKNKVQECLKTANSKMLGPNGEKLKIVLEESSDKKKDPCQGKNTKKIRIGSQDYRSSARKYEADIDCPIIVHEVGHLIGLCDEYKEQINGFYVSPDTGEIKKRGSLLDKQDNENDKFVLAYDCRVTTKNSIMSDQYKRWENVFLTGKNKSLLNSGQFNSILYGDCPSKNQLFNACAGLAYKSSVEEGNKDCLKQKRKCEENNVMGHNKTEEVSRKK